MEKPPKNYIDLFKMVKANNIIGGEGFGHKCINEVKNVKRNGSLTYVEALKLCDTRDDCFSISGEADMRTYA